MQSPSEILANKAGRGTLQDVITAMQPDADINWKCQSGSALIWAIKRGDSEGVKIVRFLLENGADPNMPSESGLTPLWVAAREGSNRYQVENINSLVKAGADVNCPSYRGTTPLMIAAQNQDDIATARRLWEHGARADICSPDGRTAYDFAVSFRHWNMAAFLYHALLAAQGGVTAEATVSSQIELEGELPSIPSKLLARAGEMLNKQGVKLGPGFPDHVASSIPVIAGAAFIACGILLVINKPTVFEADLGAVAVQQIGQFGIYAIAVLFGIAILIVSLLLSNGRKRVGRRCAVIDKKRIELHNGSELPWSQLGSVKIENYR